MTNANRTMERLSWMAAVAVLATSLSWLAAIDAVVLAHTLGAPPALAVVVRALARSVPALLSHIWPALAAAALTAVMLWTLIHAPRRNGGLNAGGSHV